MSATRLLILGLVRITQPVHGYDVRRELLGWRADGWANVAPGSIYHALKKLTEEELLREVGTEQVGARPARTRYEITPKGERVFQELLREYWWQYKEPIDPFYAAFALQPALPRDEAVGALRNRARGLRAHVENMRMGIEAGWMVYDNPPHVAELFQLEIVKAEAEADWCDRVAKRLEHNELPAADASGWSPTRPESSNIQT